ncbi:MAG: hypothetical protein GX876_10420 [Bacteroidales bacterium]|nr:hypothetical protein [Bacteroidales bacterium]
MMQTDPLPASAAPAGRLYGLLPARARLRENTIRETGILCSEYKLFQYLTAR